MSEEKFVVDSVSKAEWALKKVRKLEADIKKIQDEAEAMHTDIEKWLSKETSKLIFQKDNFEAMLQNFVNVQAEESGKRYVSLPSGRVGYRKAPIDYYLNGEKFDMKNNSILDIAKQYAPEMVVQLETVNWKDLKRTFKPVEGKVINQNGEIIEGLTAQRRPDAFYIAYAEEAEKIETAEQLNTVLDGRETGSIK